MHTEYDKESESPIVVADPDDFTCECGEIVQTEEIDEDIIECGICQKRVCFVNCIVTKRMADVPVCYGCQDDMVHERLNRED